MDSADAPPPEPLGPTSPPKSRAGWTRVLIVPLVVVLGVLGFRFYSRAGVHPSARHYNILLVTLDTTRADYLGCYGSKTARTPVLDRLAREGAQFRNCSTCVSLTAPAHASILTGFYPFVHGVRNNGSERLVPASTTLAEVLKGAGYATGAEIASAVLEHKYGFDQGFDTYHEVTTDEQNIRHYPERRGDQVADAALEQLRALAAKKFFLWVHFYDPHDPYQPPGYGGRGDLPEAYAAEITFMDTQIGRLLDELQKLGLDRRTLVVLVGDHGEGLRDHNETYHGSFVYETTLHVPCIAWCPGTIPAGRAVEARARTIDLFPTLLELVGVAPPDSVQGVSLTPLLFGSKKDLGLAAYGESLAAYQRFRMAPLRCLLDGNWKYVLAPSPTLHDLTLDPYEQSNLLAKQPNVAEDLREKLYHLIAQAPPPPSRKESAVQLTQADLDRLRGLGYVGGGATDEEVRELDLFDPLGADPRDHKETIALNELTISTLAAHNLPVAEQLLRRLTTSFPDAPGPWTDLLGVLVEQHKIEEAQEVFTRALALDPNNREARRRYAEALVLTSRWAEAKEQIVELLNAAPDDVDLVGNLGLALVGLGQLDEARAQFDLVLRLDPKSVRGIRGITRVMFQREEFAEAEKWTRDALARFPDSAGLVADSAYVAHQQGRTPEAMDLYRKALEMDPEDLSIRRAYAALLVTVENWTESAQQYAKIAAREPDNVDALYYQAAAAARLSRFDLALSLYEQAHRVAPGDARVSRGLGLVYVQMRRFADAETVLQSAVDAQPEDAGLLGDLAYTQQMQDRPTEAEALYQRALALAPADTHIRLMFAGLLMKQQRWEDAAAEFTKVTEVSPDDFDALYNLGVTLGRLERYDQARAYFERALQLRPGDTRVFHALGVLCVKQDRLPEAADYFRRALAIDPTHRGAQNDLRRVLEMLQQPPSQATSQP